MEQRIFDESGICYIKKIIIFVLFSKKTTLNFKKKQVNIRFW